MRLLQNENKRIFNAHYGARFSPHKKPPRSTVTILLLLLLLGFLALFSFRL
jgi:hypothetical protein